MTAHDDDRVSASTHSDADRLEMLERQLSLVDRVIGLEAQIAELSVRLGHAQRTDGSHVTADLVNTRQELDAVYASSTWKAGLIVSLPVRALRKVRNQVRGR